MYSSFKRIVHICGSMLVIVAIFFVLFRLQSYTDKIDFSNLFSTLWLPILILSCFTGSCNILLVLIWYRCLNYLGVSITMWNATWIYGFSQLCKYIPGNIFHLAGRQTLGMAECLPPRKIMRSIVYELVILAVGATGVFCPPYIAYYFFPHLAADCLFWIFAFCCMTVPYGIGRSFGKPLPSAIICCVLYLGSFGCVFAAMLILITPVSLSIMEIFIVASSYVVAWFVGFITPGAPAGLGVREGAMLLLLRGISIPEPDLLLAIMLCRIITIIGDCLFFVVSIGMKSFAAKFDH